MNAVEQLDLLYESLDNDILDSEAYSDEEIESQLTEAGVDLEAFAERGRTLIEECMKKRVRAAAQESLRRLQKREGSPPGIGVSLPILRAQIATTAKATCFWSVWRGVFADDPDMLERFRVAEEG